MSHFIDGFELPSQDDPLSVIIKVVGEACNLDCAYCYERRRDYEGRRLIRPETVSRFLSEFQERSLFVELHGGEPLLASKWLLGRIFGHLRNHPKPVRVRMQTNGTLLSNDWIDFLAREWPGIRLGISLDGDPAANAWRYDKAGNQSHPAIRAALELLSARNVEVGAISVVTRASLGRANEIIEHLSLSRCIRVVKFVPCFDIGVRQGKGPVRSRKTLTSAAQARDGMMPWATTPQEFTTFLMDVWRAWREGSHHHNFLLEPHATFVRAMRRQAVTDCHFSSRKCAHVLTVYPDGRVGTCDEIDRRDAEMSAGELNRQSIEGFWRGSFLGQEVGTLFRKCESCSHRVECGGGCIATRLRLEARGLGDAYCEHRKDVIDYLAAEFPRAG